VPVPVVVKIKQRMACVMTARMADALIQGNDCLR